MIFVCSISVRRRHLVSIVVCGCWIMGFALIPDWGLGVAMGSDASSCLACSGVVTMWVMCFQEGYVTGISQLWEGYPQEHAALPWVPLFCFFLVFFSTPFLIVMPHPTLSTNRGRRYILDWPCPPICPCNVNVSAQGSLSRWYLLSNLTSCNSLFFFQRSIIMTVKQIVVWKDWVATFNQNKE